MSAKTPAPKNRTMTLTTTEAARYSKKLLRLDSPALTDDILDKTICQDVYSALALLPGSFVDLLFIDPPYNLSKSFNGRQFRKRPLDSYAEWIDGWLSLLMRLVKPSASVYICADWSCSTAVHTVAQRYLKVRNRLTWEREKGRGAFRNWKNAAEDIWFCTVSDEYTFNVDAVKLKRKVIAPYTSHDGQPKDWQRSEKGNFRLTHPSNIWTDLTVPFWSMPENTDHPTQKPEKLLAKIILAGSNPRDVVLDPFLGSGTTSVVAKKLDRHFVGIEVDEPYCCLAEKRLDLAESDKSIQGYCDGVFWERNTRQNQIASRLDSAPRKSQRQTRQRRLSKLHI